MNQTRTSCYRLTNYRYGNSEKREKKEKSRHLTVSMIMVNIARSTETDSYSLNEPSKSYNA